MIDELSLKTEFFNSIGQMRPIRATQSIFPNGHIPTESGQMIYGNFIIPC